MAKYIIHTYPGRLWYVEKFLVPSMAKQGIKKSNITVYNDDKGEGNLLACMNCFLGLTEDGGTWHLQDDVIISGHFKEMTEKYDDGVVCGFSSRYDTENAGRVPTAKTWYSFPCIRIPNEIARGCAEWYFTYMKSNPVYYSLTHEGKNDDWMFQRYLEYYYKDEFVLNLEPNIVDHIDYLIGGSSVNQQRQLKIVRSSRPDDTLEKLVEELEEKLSAFYGE